MLQKRRPQQRGHSAQPWSERAHSRSVSRGPHWVMPGWAYGSYQLAYTSHSDHFQLITTFSKCPYYPSSSFCSLTRWTGIQILRGTHNAWWFKVAVFSGQRSTCFSTQWKRTDRMRGKEMCRPLLDSLCSTRARAIPLPAMKATYFEEQNEVR